jgi:hypothetical protein
MTQKEATKFIQDTFVNYSRIDIAVFNDVEYLIFKNNNNNEYIVVKQLPEEQCNVSGIFNSAADCYFWIANNNN